jgi:uncharacterized protein (DUF1697 family)
LLINEEHPMPRYVAFLRAINVGGHTVKMDHLRGLFEALGFDNVETFIASGNVIFESPEEDTLALEKRIEGHLHQALGYPTATFLRTTDELARIDQYQPFEEYAPESDGFRQYVAFTASAHGDETQVKLEVLHTPTDEFRAHGREIYWLRRINMGESEFSGALLEKVIGMPATMRNCTTLRKLVKKIQSGA